MIVLTIVKEEEEIVAAIDDAVAVIVRPQNPVGACHLPESCIPTIN